MKLTLPILTTAQEAKRKKLLALAEAAEKFFNDLPCKESAERYNEAIDRYNAYQKFIHTKALVKRKKAMESTQDRTTRLLVYLLVAAFLAAVIGSHLHS
jgi:squalene cyclase